MDDLFSAAPQQEEAPRPQDNVLTVSQLSNQLRFTVEKQFNRVAVEGEISSLKRAASGHVYFSLKDDDSVLNAIVWRSAAERIKAPFEDGLHVVAYGKLTTYGARSNYQIIIDRMEPAGLGALMQRFEELKQKLTAEGLFDEARKKPLPFMPDTIGIITSSTGAVIDDMLNRLRQRYSGRVVLWPVAVQGVGAKEQIAAAIEGFNTLPEGMAKPDVLIVARGGGSLEDLWPFNEEIVVRAVAASNIPVISGVGHEPDVTLCDYAADHRSPTPTAAAVEATADVIELKQQLATNLATLKYFIEQRLKTEHQRVRLAARGLSDQRRALDQWRMRLEDRQNRLLNASTGRLKLLRQRLTHAQQRLRPQLLQQFFAQNKKEVSAFERRLLQTMQAQLGEHNRHLKARAQLLQHLSPKAPLEKGYALVTDAQGNLLKSADTTASDIRIEFKDGTRDATLKPQS